MMLKPGPSTAVGVGIELVGQGLPIIWPAMPKMLAWFLILGGGLLIAYGIFAFLYPRVKEYIPAPSWLPEKWQDSIDWAKYKPRYTTMLRIGPASYSVNEGTVVNCSVGLDISFWSNFPYGETRPFFSDPTLVLFQKRGHRNYAFNFLFDRDMFERIEGGPMPIGSLDIPPMDYKSFMIRFVWEHEGRKKADAGPLLDHEFKWQVTGLGAVLLGPRPIERLFETIRGVQRGRKG